MCCPNWTQAFSHIIGYISGPIGILFAIAPTHILEWHYFMQIYVPLKKIPRKSLLWGYHETFTTYRHDKGNNMA